MKLADKFVLLPFERYERLTKGQKANIEDSTIEEKESDKEKDNTTPQNSEQEKIKDDSETVTVPQLPPGILVRTKKEKKKINKVKWLSLN